MDRGKIKLIEKSQGYGFVETDAGVKVFFHQRWLRKVRFKDLKIGDEVVFSINEGPRGPRAFKLCPASLEKEDKKIRPVERLFKE